MCSTVVAVVVEVIPVDVASLLSVALRGVAAVRTCEIQALPGLVGLSLLMARVVGKKNPEHLIGDPGLHLIGQFSFGHH